MNILLLTGAIISNKSAWGYSIDEGLINTRLNEYKCNFAIHTYPDRIYYFDASMYDLSELSATYSNVTFEHVEGLDRLSKTAGEFMLMKNLVDKLSDEDKIIKLTGRIPVEDSELIKIYERIDSNNIIVPSIHKGWAHSWMIACSGATYKKLFNREIPQRFLTEVCNFESTFYTMIKHSNLEGIGWRTDYRIPVRIRRSSYGKGWYQFINV